MKAKFRVDHLPFSSLAFDDRYQRAMMPARVHALMGRWKLEDVGAITVNIRGGKPYVIDGQHRVRAAMELGLGDTKVLCHVYTGLTVEDEAHKFLALNDARSVTPLDRYRAGLVAKDPVAIGIRDILAKHGLVIGNASPKGGVLRCVSKAVMFYGRDPDLLDRICAVLVEAWGTRSSAVEQVVFTAAGIVLDRYNGEIDQSLLVRKLAKYRGGPAALMGDARGWSDVKPISVTRAAAEIMVDVYNRGKRSGQLSPL